MPTATLMLYFNVAAYLIMVRYIKLLLFLFAFTYSKGALSQCVGFFYPASNFDLPPGTPDTFCVEECQKFWINDFDNCNYIGNTSFHWVFRDVVNDTLIGDTVYHCYNQLGTYYIDVYASNFDLDSAASLNITNVIIPCAPHADFKVDKPIICANECVQFTDLSTGVVKQWAWAFDGGTPATFIGKEPPPICFADTGNYAVRLTTSNTFASDDTLATTAVNILPGPVPWPTEQSFVLREGDIATLDACARGSSYIWQPTIAILENTDTTLTVQPDQSQLYNCTIATANGCKTTCLYQVQVQGGLLVPTGFSPNGDGVNDLLRILNDNIKLTDWRIFNRWGELVFSTTNQLQGWDGTFRNTQQEIGAYIWTATYTITKTGKQKTAKGGVTLVR